MTLIEAVSSLSWQDIEQVLNEYEALGPFAGILATMIESFLPILPLVAILIANVNAYGLLEGIFLSWLGVNIGAVTVFWVARRFGGGLRRLGERKFPRLRSLLDRLERIRFTPIFLLACFPFTPSFLLNVVSGLSRVPFHTFLIATASGKLVMIFLVSFLGYDLDNLFHQPFKLVAAAILFALMWLGGKKIEAKYFKA